MTGKSIRHKKISSAIFQTKRHRKKNEAKEVWELLRKIDELCFAKTFNAINAIRYLQNLQRLFHEHDNNVETSKISLPNRDKNAGQTVLHMVYLFGGVEVLQRLLFHPSLSEAKGGILNSSKQIIRALAFDILNGLCLLLKDVAVLIGSYDYLIMHLFSAMEDNRTHSSASTLLEELLATNRKIVDLSTVGNIEKLIKDLDDFKFPAFCRLLSTSIADFDFSEEKVTLILQDREEKTRSKEKSIAEKNQDFLLSIPEFTERMVKLCSKPLKNSSTLLSSRLFSLPAVTMDLMDLTELGAAATENTNEESASSSSSNSSRTSRTSAVPATSTSSGNTRSLANELLLQGTHQFLTEIMRHVEILYVITLFLCGEHKAEVQEKLSDSKLLPALCDMFESLEWSVENVRFSRHTHSETQDCNCTPESVLKIQYLRFVHSFSDHNDKKYILLSLREAEEMRNIFDVCKVARPAILEKSKSKYLCHGPKGLLSKIIDTLKSTAANNALRFWLCRAVEGFLRGRASPPDQMFLINRDLVKHLFEHIVDGDTKSKDTLQSSFDLLGEVMKFNAEAFKQFNESVQDETQFEKFLSVMTSNIVDSNMFIRCIALSYEKFIKLGNYDVYSCCLSGLIIRWEQKMYLIYKLITSISVDSLTQENVSCLNTILVFLIFAYRHRNLDEYLNAFLMEERAHQHSGLILNNLYELLTFWRVHYFERTKDCSQLGQSSCISFEKWRDVVEVLLNQNSEDKTSILHYMNRRHLRLCSIERASRDV